MTTYPTDTQAQYDTARIMAMDFNQTFYVGSDHSVFAVPYLHGPEDVEWDSGTLVVSNVRWTPVQLTYRPTGLMEDAEYLTHHGMRSLESGYYVFCTVNEYMDCGMCTDVLGNRDIDPCDNDECCYGPYRETLVGWTLLKLEDTK